MASTARTGEGRTVDPLAECWPYAAFGGRFATRSARMPLPRKVFILVLFLARGAPFTIGSVTRSSSTGLMGVYRQVGAPVGPSRP
ncbi:hypothetical protein FAGKG844_40006 [Frankia sp. AgKG'84/4]